MCVRYDIIAVAVPPKSVIIKDKEGNALNGLVGPYNEGDSVTLICDAYGGLSRLIG